MPELAGKAIGELHKFDCFLVHLWMKLKAVIAVSLYPAEGNTLNITTSIPMHQNINRFFNFRPKVFINEIIISDLSKLEIPWMASNKYFSHIVANNNVELENFINSEWQPVTMLATD